MIALISESCPNPAEPSYFNLACFLQSAAQPLPLFALLLLSAPVVALVLRTLFVFPGFGLR